MVTIKDIARMAGVSPATVSRALSGSLAVSAQTRERILNLCRQSGYRANSLARSLSGSRTGLIGCVLPDLDNPLFAEMALNVEQCAWQRGYHVMLCHGRAQDPTIRDLFDFLIGHRVDGILFFSSAQQTAALVHEYQARIPIVLQGNCVDSSGISPVPCVNVHNIAGGRLAAEYLHSLGHRRAVYLGVREQNLSHALRLQGFSEAARHLGMSVRVIPNPGPASTIAVGYQLAKDFFIQNFKETAIFAACDSVALGVMASAKEFDLSIPGDLSLLGFDNISYASLPNVRLTTIDQQKKELIETTVDCLLNLIESGSPPAENPLLIKPILLERSTCAKNEQAFSL